MKYITKYLLAFVALVAAFASCDKKDMIATHLNGTAVILSESATAIAPAPIDSNATAVKFSWTNPLYAQDTSLYKFVVQIDSNVNFAHAYTKTVTGTAFNTSMLNKELNAIALGLGFSFNIVYTFNVRVISSYGNNNESYNSNVLQLKYTPYKVPPKVALPASGKLWANGGALTWSWTGNPPTPQSEFSRINNELWGGVFNLAATNEFLVLGQNGGTNPYDKKYAIPNKSVSGVTAGGDFGYYPPGTGGDNFQSPATTGWYKINMDFQTGKYAISSFGSNALAQDLYITGSATASDWTNTPPAAQKFTRLNSSEYEITVPFIPGKEYKFLSSSGNWQPQFGGSSATGGQMGANYGGGSDPSNIPTPSVAGNYKINVNFFTNVYTVTKQ